MVCLSLTDTLYWRVVVMLEDIEQLGEDNVPIIVQTIFDFDCPEELLKCEVAAFLADGQQDVLRLM